MKREEVIARCFDFIRQIGLEIEERAISETTFVPGITISDGRLIVDQQRMLYPGDLLHEAGHIALIESQYRSRLQANVATSEGGSEGYEIGVLLWSYFAGLKAGIPLTEIFHPQGYKGDSQWLIDQFTDGRYIGLPLLEWMGIAVKQADGGVEIKNWLRK
jgi:hypothetical protein